MYLWLIAKQLCVLHSLQAAAFLILVSEHFVAYSDTKVTFPNLCPSLSPP